MPLVATANVLDRLGPVEAGEALAAVLAHHPDLVGLQEWGRSRRGLLRRHASYGWVSPVYGGNAVGFARERYALAGRRLVRLGLLGLADRGARPVPVLPPRVATSVRLHDRLTGGTLTVVDYHLVPGTQARGRYRDDRPLLVARHRRETARLAGVVAALLAEGEEVCALGDSNLDGFELPGLTSAWAGRRDDPRGTLGSSRKIDDVLARGRAEEVTLVRTASDHAAVLARRPD